MFARRGTVGLGTVEGTALGTVECTPPPLIPNEKSRKGSNFSENS
jgi:hypothetical protein